MDKLRNAVVASSVELLMGLAMVGLGIAFTTIDLGLASIGGSILAVLGGILVSWGFTKSYVAETAKTDFTNSVRSLQRRLGTVSGQIG